MSIITAIFLVGAFVTIASLFWWTRREIEEIDSVLATHQLRLNDTQKEVSTISVKLGKIQVTVDNTENMTEKLMDHILK